MIVVILRFGLVWLGFSACLLMTVTDANLRYLRTVAFSAQRTQRVPATSPEGTIGLYGRMVRPDANHFDSDSGVFTVPIKGVYAFAFTFHQELSAGPAPPTAVKLVRESSDRSVKTDVVTTEGPWAPAAGRAISVPGASVLLELDKDDQLYLVTSNPVDAGDNQPISFSGYLLTRL
ncbi:uncharacterized protein LOC110988784 [Acanthaster planci]|uniref:Uncharacterized protein LOC110988784 n=1 Tax=Acanthaster planci TaxID=133434 RepID=A0A8B7ZT97_ACAPL|nr:uncharacterized protein LOC110988784 [Acanthaster planci]